MRTFRVLENDVKMAEILGSARAAGFEDLRLAVFNSAPFHLPLDEFDAFMEAGRGRDRYGDATRSYLKNRRMFFLRKAGTEVRDSRQRAGLAADLRVEIRDRRVASASSFRVVAGVTNTSVVAWRPGTARIGAVNLGVHLYDDAGTLLNLDYFREPLTAAPGRLVQPGESLELSFDLPAPRSGRYILEFDLVSEGVSWFANTGSRPTRISVEVV
jgi:hypothetical protein